MKNYYVYCITDITTNEFYIGSRGCYEDPEDDSYMGSPSVWKPILKNLKKEILKCNFKNVQNAILFERKLILQNINHPLNRNYAIPHPSITRDCLITAKHINEINEKSVSISSNDPLFGKKYVGYTKGFVVVRDADGVIFQTDINDSRYISGELKHVATGMREKELHPNWNKLWINNRRIQKFINRDKLLDFVSCGWTIGTLQKGKKSKSSHSNSTWVHNENKSVRIIRNSLDEYLNIGYKLGRGKLKKYDKRQF